MKEINKRPLILVTNDDGIDSLGLAAAARGALRVGDVVIAAPNVQQTAMGRAYPHREDLGIIDIVQLDIGIGHSVEAYAVHGSPGYAAAYGVAEICPKIKGRKPDITVSGINTGANCGSSITSSGTIGAALESVDMGVQALAMSLEILDYDSRMPDFSDLDFTSAEKATEYWIRYILEKGMPRDADFLNVNVPEEVVEPEDHVFTFLETHPYYKAQPIPERDWSKPYRIGFDSEFGDKDARVGSDIHTLHFLRKTSVTPITIDMTKW
ncbi:MAG: 5'/3'-nucleotidase SurE [Firmicutes bacterium]|nr:5'/3'-nucleotidase SurE [Bacillota bacterium]